MNTSRLLLAGLLLGTSVSMGGCVTAHVPVPLPNPRYFIPSAFLPPETYIVTDESAHQRALECAGTDGSTYAPGIMTYDSKTHIETHQDAYRDSADVSVEDHDTDRVTGVHVEAGVYPERQDVCVADGSAIHRIVRGSPRDTQDIREDYKRQKRQEHEDSHDGGDEGEGN